MYYNFEVTPPTRIKSGGDYKQRMAEITRGQISNLFDKCRLRNPFFWVFAIIFIPCSILYLLGCIFEIVIDTLLFPLSLIPYIRGIPIAAMVLIWSLTVAIGCFACVSMTYDLEVAQ